MSNNKNNPPISVHSFMFLFRWDLIINNTTNEKSFLSQRSNLVNFHNIFTKCNTLKRSIFNLNEDKQKYNEFIYFHSFARTVLYDSDASHFENKTTLFYEITGNEGDYFQIETLENNSFKLSFKSIKLHVFNTGVGLLSFNLENYTYNNEHDILCINEFGRRIYPQFLDNNEDCLLSVKKTFLADRIHGKIDHLSFDEDFKQYNSILTTDDVFLVPDFIKMII